MNGTVERHPLQVALRQTICVGGHRGTEIRQGKQHSAHHDVACIAVMPLYGQQAAGFMVTHIFDADTRHFRSISVGRENRTGKTKDIHIFKIGRRVQLISGG